MQSTIASIPGALVVRALVTSVIILVLMSTFFSYTEDVDEKIEILARERVIQELNIALSFYLYQAATTGDLQRLSSAHLQNPFILLSGANYRIPPDYRGELGAGSGPELRGWYFDSGSRSIYYWEGRKKLSEHQLRFDYLDNNANSRFDSGVDAIKGFAMSQQQKNLPG